MWSLRSLGHASELAIVAFDGTVSDRGRYLVVKTPSSPDYWWGNFLLYPEPPEPRAALRGHDESWLDDLDREFPSARAGLLAWDRPDGARGATEAFAAEGFGVDEGVILTTERVHPSDRYNPSVRVEPVLDEATWVKAADALVNAFAPRRSGTMDDLRSFTERQLNRYRAIQRSGLGQWFVAKLDGQVAGALGLVEEKGRYGRFQLVGTDARFGRQGVCSTMVFEVARWGLEERRLPRLVMAADATYHAARVYESVGFAPTERLFAVIRKPPTQ